MSQHTKGPWHAEYFPHAFGWDVTHGPADDATERFSVFDDPSEADARLMAAAPDLLKACKVAWAVITGEAIDETEPGAPSGAAMNLLAAAIKKAEPCP